MTIDEAIGLLFNKVKPCDPARDPEAYDAIKLGIEGLKAYQKGQEAGWYPPGYKLPGETEE